MAELKNRATLDTKPFNSGLQGMSSKVNSFSTGLAALGPQIGVAFSAVAVMNFAKEAAKAGDEIDNLSKQVDLSVESVQTLSFLGKEAGVSFETLRPTINQFRRAVSQASSGNEAMASSFARLGVSMGDLRTLRTEDVLEKVSSAIAKNADNSEILAESTKILGAESTRLLPVLKELGQEGFGKLNAELERTGHILGARQVAVLDASEEAWSRLGNTVTTKARSAFADLTDVFTTAMLDLKGGQEAVDQYNARIRKLTENHSRATEAINETSKAVQDFGTETSKIESDKYFDVLESLSKARLEMAKMDPKFFDSESFGLEKFSLESAMQKANADLEKALQEGDRASELSARKRYISAKKQLDKLAEDEKKYREGSKSAWDEMMEKGFPAPDTSHIWEEFDKEFNKKQQELSQGKDEFGPLRRIGANRLTGNDPNLARQAVTRREQQLNKMAQLMERTNQLIEERNGSIF